ncbi:MAG: metallophosphoesterase family protein [bacterium]
MYYIIGDIHGCYDKLRKLYEIIASIINENDTLIFLGDYIDRGAKSYEVIEFLNILRKIHTTVLLRGNHEDMFLSYLKNNDTSGLYLYNGGMITLENYRKKQGSVALPEKHKDFFNSLRYYYETDEFIAVHAGLRPGIDDIKDQSEYDLIWIREKFFLSSYTWPKLIVFGHTQTEHIPGGKWGKVYFNKQKNIAGVDTGAVFGGKLSCLRLPDRIVYQV